MENNSELEEKSSTGHEKQRYVTTVVPFATIVGAIIESIKRMRDVICTTLFLLFVLAVLGLQVYMGILTQKCIKEFPTDGSAGNLTDDNWAEFMRNESNWYVTELEEIELCGNSSGSGQCPTGYVCLQGFGPNPNFGYTNFDTFGYSFLAIFQLLMRDFWEDLYQLVLRAAGPWHILFFAVIIFYGAFYIFNLFLISIAIVYEKLTKKDKRHEEIQSKISIELKTLGEDKTENLIAIDKVDQSTNGQSAVTNVTEATEINEIQTSGEVNGNNKLSKTEKDTSCSDVIFGWKCCKPLQEPLTRLMFHPIVELFIIICTIIYFILLALDHHDMEQSFATVLRRGNYIFVAIFVIEAVLKILALGPKSYFKNGWNCFDFVIVAANLLDIGLEGVQGYVILASFRVLRVLNLAKFWPKLNLLLSIIGHAFGRWRYLTYLLIISIFIFTEVGLQFGGDYIEHKDRFPDMELPRWNFTDFFHSFMVVFRIFCGEWIETLWECMLVGDGTCIPMYLIIILVGNLLVFSLFIALLLTNFGPHRLIDPNSIEVKKNTVFASLNCFGNLFNSNNDDTKALQELSSVDDQIEDDKEESLANCLPNACSSSADNNSPPTGWTNFRLKIFKLVQSRYYKIVILIFVFVSSVALIFEDIHLKDNQSLSTVLEYIDLIMMVMFLVEMILNWIAYGLKVYFSNGWFWLDFINTMCQVSEFLITLSGGHPSQFLHAIRILRVLKPFFAYANGSAAIVDMLVKSITSIISASVVSFLIWSIFAVIGVQLFAGKFYKCIDENVTLISHEIIPNHNDCISNNHKWENSPINFDHIGNAYLSLFQVSTFKGWIHIMSDAVDSREINSQPIRETNLYMFLYFVLFIIFTSFFTFNLFVGVLVDYFFERKKKVNGFIELFMSKGQRKTYNKMRTMENEESDTVVPRPQWKPQAIVYDIVTTDYFEIVSNLVIILNVAVMGLDHFQESAEFTRVLDIVNLVFVGYYILECVLKIFALRLHYFKDKWNLFDFLVVVLLILGLILADVFEKFFISPTLLRLVRLLRLVKFAASLSYIKGTKGIRTLLFTYKLCLPAFYNFSFLLFIIAFIYAIFGMTFFMHVKQFDGLDDLNNFTTFGRSIIVLFQLYTSAGWDGVFSAVTNDENCSDDNCGSFVIGSIYILSYIIITSYILIFMCMAIVLENYSQTVKVAESLEDVTAAADDDKIIDSPNSIVVVDQTTENK